MAMNGEAGGGATDVLGFQRDGPDVQVFFQK